MKTKRPFACIQDECWCIWVQNQGSRLIQMILGKTLGRLNRLYRQQPHHSTLEFGFSWKHTTTSGVSLECADHPHFRGFHKSLVQFLQNKFPRREYGWLTFKGMESFSNREISNNPSIRLSHTSASIFTTNLWRTGMLFETLSLATPPFHGNLAMTVIVNTNPLSYVVQCTNLNTLWLEHFTE